MQKPKINIEGKIYEAQEPRGRAWRMLAALDENKSEIPNVEFIEKHAEVIVQFFPNLSVEEILDNMTIPDIIKSYYDCYKFASAIMYSKLKPLDSTEGVEEAER